MAKWNKDCMVEIVSLYLFNMELQVELLSQYNISKPSGRLDTSRKLQAIDTIPAPINRRYPAFERIVSPET